MEAIEQPRQYQRRLQTGILIAMRLMLLVALPLEGIQGYGDFRHFFELAWLAVDGGGGLPFITHWVEFPPMFPFISVGIYILAGGVEYRYVYLLALVMLAFDAGCLVLFQRLAGKFTSAGNAERVGWIYLVYLMLPAFGWWTFEPIGVFLALLTFLFILEDKPVQAGVAAGLGILTKLIPALPLLGLWAKRRWKAALTATLLAFMLAAIAVIPLFREGGAFAKASLQAQFTKGSWETVWALFDRNLTTGSYGPIEEHLSLDAGLISRGNPSRIPHWIPTLLAAGVGLWLFLRMKGDIGSLLRIITAAWCMMFLWSKGWSPQWLAYLIPFLLLALPLREALVFSMALMLTSLAEWPLLLSRGRFDLLWITVPLRTIVLLLLTYVLAKMILNPESASKGAL